MQSHSKSKQKKKQKQKRPRGLPWGFGSLHLHGRKWWMVYRNEDDQLRHENSECENPAEALRLLAQRSLPRARAAVETLEKIASGEENPSNGEAGASAARRDSSAERNARSRANREVSQEAAGAGGKSPRTRSPRKGGKAE